MFWLQRPPYVRWAAAACLLAAAFAWDASKRRTEPYPVAAHRVERGDAIEDVTVRWVDVPAGLFPAPDLTGAVAARPLDAGEPISRSAVEPGIPVPEGWWSIPVPLPAGAFPGSNVRLIVAAPGSLDAAGSFDGIVVTAPSPDPFASSPNGLVAVPGEAAGSLAVAAAEGLVVALVAP